MCTNGGHCWKSMGPRLSILKAYTTLLQMQSQAWVWPQRQSNSWELPHNESQELKTQSETKLNDSVKTLVQSRIDTNTYEDLNFAFANHGEEDEMYHLTTIEMAKAQQKDGELKVYFEKNTKIPKKDVCFQLVDDAKVLCKNGKLIIPTSLRHRSVAWYHHYLQHPGHSHLKKTMRSVIYWKGLRTTIQNFVKSCKSCQVNKRHS